jgi:hypothetical protein
LALKELSTKELKANRSAELKAFVAEARAQLGQKPATSPAGKPIGGLTPTAGAPAAQAAVPAATITTAVAPLTTAVQAGTTATAAVKSSITAASVAAGTKAQAQLTKTDALVSAMSSVKSALMAISSKIATQATASQIAQNTAQALTLLSQINTSVKSSGMGGGIMGPGGFSPPLGGAQGSLGNAAGMASANGLQVTSSFRPGDKGYHGVGRAMDFSNSTGPTPQMMAFAQQMIAKYGSSLTELIYSPLGFSIKNGQKVAPLAYGSHFNHVHVAFAHGPGNPRLFSSAQAAQAYEGMYAPAGAQVKTVTANTSENLGGTYNVTQNINISGAEDPRRLAEMVFNYAAQAAQHINNSSFA